MQKIIRIILLQFIFLSLFTCKDSGISNCLKGPGETVTKEFEIESFTDVNLYDRLDIYLVDDTVYKIKIIADENIIEDIQSECKDSVLSISADISCEFLKDTDIERRVYIHSPDISKIFIYGANRIFSEDTLYYPRFLIRIHSKIAFVDIKLSCNHFFLEQWNSTGNFNVEGETVYYSILNHGYSYIYSDKLKAQYVHITQKSTGDNYVSAEKKITANIYETGNIYYIGEPEINIEEQTSSGKIIQINN
jgi:hypothetical protein